MKAIFSNLNKKQNTNQLGVLLFLLSKINQSFAENTDSGNSSKLKVSQFLPLIGYNVDSEETTGFSSLEVIL